MVESVKSGIMLIVDASAKNIMYVKKITFSNPAIFSCKNGKYLTNIIDNDSVVTCDDTKLYNADTETKLYDEESRTVPTKFNEKL